MKVDIMDSRVNAKGEAIYKCPRCACYHLIWRTKLCKHCGQTLKW